MDPLQQPTIVNVHTPSASFAIPHSFVQETLQSLYSKLDSKLASVQEIGSGDEPVGAGWVKYEWNDTVWNLDDDSDYTILTWRQKQASSDSDTVGMALFLHNPSLPLPQPPAYTNPSYYLFKRVASMSPKARSVSTNGARSTHSRKSRKSVRSVGSGMLDDGGVPKYKKDFFKTHNQNGVRTVIGTIGPVKGMRMLLKSGYRHVYISRSFARKYGFIPSDAKPGMYGYGGLVNIGKWPITTGKTTTMHSVYLSEETHFDCILGRSFMELRGVKTDPLDPTNVQCLDNGEKLECELVIIRDGNGEIVTVT